MAELRLRCLGFIVACLLLKNSEGKLPDSSELTIKISGDAVTCEAGWVVNPFHNTCVKPVDSALNWFKARDACSEERSTLLHVDIYAMEKFLANSVNITSTREVWTAGNDIVEEELLMSVFRSRLNFTSWAKGQPNDQAKGQGGPHTQNCIMDVVNTDNAQEDKSCSSKAFAYVCERWPRDFYGAVFTKLDINDPAFRNYGLGSEADDISSVVGSRACASLCIARHYFCEVFVYSVRLQRCKLLRLYATGYDKALTDTQMKELSGGVYEAFGIVKFSV